MVREVGTAVSRIRREVPIFREPRRERPGRYADAEARPNMLGGSLTRLASVIIDEGFEDNFQRVTFALCALRGEDPITGAAIPQLDGLKLFVALAFPGDFGAAAVNATLEFLANQTTDAGARTLLVWGGVLCHTD